jgi:hypothetical protein
VLRRSFPPGSSSNAGEELRRRPPLLPCLLLPPLAKSTTPAPASAPAAATPSRGRRWRMPSGSAPAFRIRRASSSLVLLPPLHASCREITRAHMRRAGSGRSVAFGGRGRIAASTCSIRSGRTSRPRRLAEQFFFKNIVLQTPGCVHVRPRQVRRAGRRRFLVEVLLKLPFLRSFHLFVSMQSYGWVRCEG